MDGLTNQPIVIDNGTGVLKAGFAGGDRPRIIFSSAVGRPKHVRMMPGGALEGTDVCVGSKLQEHRGAFRWSYPMEHGVVMDWQDMERVWSHLYSRDQLNVPSEEHPVRVCVGARVVVVVGGEERRACNGASKTDFYMKHINRCC